jgi:hypothetical protein
MEHSNLQPGMDLLMNLPAVIACVIALPLDEILEAVIPHMTIKNLLNFIFILTINDNRGWRRGMLMTQNWVRECEGQFNSRKD